MKQSRPFPLIACVIGGLLVGTGAGYARWRHTPVDYALTRSGFVRLNADLAPPVDFVALGDSVTESIYFGPVCGTWFNAGVGAAKVEDVAAIARYVLPKLKPKTILVAAGANDFWMIEGDIEKFRRQYAALLDGLPPAKIILMGVPNSAAATAFVQRQAKARGFRYIEPITGTHHTIKDGVHLTAAGARLYRERVRGACV